MHKLLFALLLVSTNSSADLLSPACTDEMIYDHKMRVTAVIRANVKYPRVAFNREMSGSGVVYFEFSNEDAVPKNIQIIQSTGYSILDNEIIHTIKTVDLPATTCDMAEKKFKIYAPVTFRLHVPENIQQKNNLSPKPSPIPLHESTG
jgi:TonB family protein